MLRSANASGGTVFAIDGASGRLFEITDDLTGDIFTVSDISGYPFLNIDASGNIEAGISGSTTTISGILMSSANCISWLRIRYDK